MLSWLNKEFEKGKVSGDRERAEILKAMMKGRGQDVSWPYSERHLEIKRFSGEAHQELEKRGFMVYELTGQESIKSLREQGFPFWTTWHKDYQDYPDFEAQTARASEVAINPDPRKVFIPGSNGKTLDQQLRMVSDFSRKLGVNGAIAEIGGVGDYVGVVAKHLNATGVRLFGEKYDYDYARTVTPTVGSSVAIVGCFSADRGLRVSHFGRGYGGYNVWAAPLVVPV